MVPLTGCLFFMGLSLIVGFLLGDRMARHLMERMMMRDFDEWLAKEGIDKNDFLARANKRETK